MPSRSNDGRGFRDSPARGPTTGGASAVDGGATFHSMSRRRRTGRCHLCGETGELSFEHVPPRAAFNNKRIEIAGGEEILSEEQRSGYRLDKLRGKIHQRGMGAFTLCPDCNNRTGSWYGPAYIDWAVQGAMLLAKAGAEPTLAYPYWVFPLRVFKQILCMFFSCNGPDFRDAHPDLARFVLDRDRVYIDTSIRVFAYLHPTGTVRKTGIASMLNLARHEVRVLSDLAFPPFGYLMTVDSEPTDDRLVDLSFFARFRPDDFKDLFLRLPVLPVSTYFPGDYRTREEVEVAAAESLARNPTGNRM